MGSSRGDFTKYPRTAHLFGSEGTSDDRHLNQEESEQLIADESLIVEEKLDGTNVGLHFNDAGELVLQCRGHLIVAGMHPQYDLFKQWATVKQPSLEEQLTNRLILFGEWMYAKHSIYYQQLTHYFFEFDIYDKQKATFLNLEARLELVDAMEIETVPVIHEGPVEHQQLQELIGPSLFESQFENPFTGETDNLMEGLYLRIEADHAVSQRAKLVRPEFVEKIKQSTHWQHQEMIPNKLAEDVDLGS